MAKLPDTVEIEVTPTVSLGSAVACVVMLNMFLAANDGYRLIRSDGGYRLTDDPKAGGGAR
jgi:hypothetical protein